MALALASIHTSTSFFSSSSVPLRRSVNASIRVPKTNNFSVPKIPTKNNVEGLTIPLLNGQKNVLSNYDITMQLYAILDSVSDRIEMHNNLSQQRQNWNNLLLNNINMITLTATTLTGVAAASGAIGAPLLALKLSSTLLFSAATGLLLIMNKIQPSQLAEEQRNATRLFKQLRAKIETGISLGNLTEHDVRCLVENVLALDKAYPLPLLGVMLEKFPEKYEPAVWWPRKRKEGNTAERKMKKRNSNNNNNNGWSEELEMELKEVIEVVKRKDIEDYERLGNMILKVNKSLGIAGPLLTGIAAIGSACVGNSSIAAIVAVMAGSLGAVVNAIEHGGQIGMVFEMYRNCGGFFKLLEESVDDTLEEKDYEMRENGELFEMKMALMLGRSVCEMRQLALKSVACRMEGIEVDEFASKLF
ncbi:probable F-box protein At4g22030 [Vicia villosa]|uniref:probable F-box protein At4g22030 n=1 Tax=Vicia villosa TaxID=3911 RepID=UPI00273B0B81|nr:probable F-box protein At4g22030 [Vicia villosa]XP_058763353.1 probable F-box protein At4g22030 [Vicia villosa]